MEQTQTKTANPVLSRLQLGVQLRVLREAAGLEAHQAAYKLRCVVGKIYHLENGRSMIRPVELDVLLTLYGASDRLEELDAMRVEATQKGWWADYQLPPSLARYIGLEDAAVRIRRFTNGVIPGQLQTEEYARVVNRVTTKPGTDDEERNIAARLQRGARLAGGDVKFSTILGQEALLRTSYVPGGVGVGQLKKILDVMELPNVTVRMLPLSVGPYSGMEQSFTLLEFPEGTLGPVAYEARSRDESPLDRETTEALGECYTEAMKLTLDPGETVEEIEELIRDAKEIYPT